MVYIDCWKKRAWVALSICASYSLKTNQSGNICHSGTPIVGVANFSPILDPFHGRESMFDVDLSLALYYWSKSMIAELIVLPRELNTVV